MSLLIGIADMECATRNFLVQSYLRSQANKAEAELAALEAREHAAEERILAARRELIARRKELLDHCEKHGC